MATAVYGEQVGKQMLASFTTSPPGPQIAASAALDATLAKLHALEPGSEQAAQSLALAALRAASTDAERATAISLLAAALVLDPTVEGYKDRLTDAYGLAAWAGTVDSSDPIAHGARAFVAAAAGANTQAQALVDVVARAPKATPEARAFSALARDIGRDRSDAFFDDVHAALQARPTSMRLRTLLAQRLLDLGLAEEAIAALGDAAGPVVDLLRGRAALLQDKPDDAEALLKKADAALVGVDEPRRGDVLFTLLQVALARVRHATDDAAKQAAATSTGQAIAALSARAGYAREAAWGTAELARAQGRFDDARAALAPFDKGTPFAPVDADIARTLAELCDAPTTAAAPEGAEACRLRAQRRLAMLDVHESQQAPTTKEARLLLAARRALAWRAPVVAERALTSLSRDAACRACRALRVKTTTDFAEQGKRALAAMQGGGPALELSDLLVVIDGLGANKTPAAEAALKGLDADAREPVRRAVAQARAELRDPELRKRRFAADHDDDEHGGRHD